MSAVVCFRTGYGTFGLPVAVVRGVIDHAGVVPLPEPRPGVAGLLRPEREALPVLDVLGADGRHLLLLLVAGRRFALVAGEVTGVRRDGEAAPPPADGTLGPLLSGALRTAGGTVLLVDPAALAGRLRPGPAG